MEFGLPQLRAGYLTFTHSQLRISTLFPSLAQLFFSAIYCSPLLCLSGTHPWRGKLDKDISYTLGALFNLVYLDDILFFSKDKIKHKFHIHQVLHRLLENCLYVKEKCEFHVPSVAFLGYNFEDEQVKTDSKMIKEVTEWPKPASCKLLQLVPQLCELLPAVEKNWLLPRSFLSGLHKRIWPSLN